jgi:hypothetical protein
VGLEPLDIARIIPDARVLGCDISIPALQQAHERCEDRGIAIFRSTPSALRAFGPYDGITAINVLLRYPEIQGVEDISEIYPFQVFESQLAPLVDSLRPGGVLLLYNACYLFEQTAHARLFEPVPRLGEGANGWADKYDRSGVRISLATGYVDEVPMAKSEWRRAVLEAPEDTRSTFTYSVARIADVLPDVTADLTTIVWRKVI